MEGRGGWGEAVMVEGKVAKGEKGVRGGRRNAR